MIQISSKGSDERHSAAAWNSSAALLRLWQTWCQQLSIFSICCLLQTNMIKTPRNMIQISNKTWCNFLSFFCEGSQLWWHWLLDRARAYTCLRWPRPQVSQNESVDFICWWTISGLVVKAILRTGGATTQQPSSMREQSVWLEPILSYQTNIKQKSNK